MDAWSQRDRPLEERVEATHIAALELGLRNVEPAARALIAQMPPEGPEAIAVARAAVRLAPDLPSARMALALACWRELELLEGTRAAAGAVLAFGRSLDAAFWLQAAVFRALGLALVGGAAAYLLLRALFTARFSAHDLGDALSSHTPDFSRGALLACVLLAPAALGQGLLGLCLGSLVVAIAWGAGRRGLWVDAAAAVVVLLGLHPALLASGRALAAFQADPVAVAAYTAEHGLAWPMHLARLTRASGEDALAARALALGMKRTGDLVQADARYGALLAAAPGDPELMNNAANVRLALGDTPGAIALYEKALAAEPSAVGWFNLSQAFGVALNVVELDAALAKAQGLDPALVEDLSEIQGRATHFVADIPVPSQLLRARLLAAGDASAVARDLRRPLAPGVLGSGLVASAAGLAAALGAGLALRRRLQTSRACQRCNALMCGRCHGPAVRGLCATCDRLAHADNADPSLRAARAQALAARRERGERAWLAAGVVLPGLAWLRAGRPALALASCLAAAGAAAFALGRHGPVPDPLAAGAAGPALLLAAAVASGVVYAGLLAGAVAALRSR